MNRSEARKLAESVTLEELLSMFKNAQDKITDWTTASRPNKGLSLGVAYNILSKGLTEKKNASEIHIIAKTNMIWSFGEYLPNYAKIVRDKKPNVIPAHQKPDFIF